MLNQDEKSLLEKCRRIDFSANSTSQEKTLEVLQSKLKNFREGEIHMKETNKRFRKPVAIVAALVAILSLSVIAVAAGPVIRYLETRVLQGEDYVSMLVAKEGENWSMVGIEISENATGPIIVEIDGEMVVVMDRRVFYDLDEALSHLAVDSPMLPTYIPEGFTFENATFNICPINNPNQVGTRNLDINYRDGQNQLRISISYRPEEWGMPMWIGDQREIEINGNKAGIGGGILAVQSNDTMYLIDSAGLEEEQLIRIAESLR